MPYKVEMTYPGGTTEEMDEIFETEGEAREYGEVQCSNYAEGGRISLLRAGMDDHLDEDDHADFEVIEVDA